MLDGPLGQFILAERKADKLLFIAGGSGITPLRAMMEAWAQQGKSSILLYANKTSVDIMLKKEVDQFTADGKAQVIHVLGNKETGYLQGYIDQPFLQHNVPDLLERDVFLCGPKPMMKAVGTALLNLGLPKKRIHMEEFSL